MANGELPSAIVDVRSTDPIPEIPDSEANQKLIHRWYLSEDTDPFADSIGSSDGTNNGTAQVTGSQYVGGAAREGDGSSDYVNVGKLGTFGSSMDTDFAIAMTIDGHNGGNSIAIGANSNLSLGPRISQPNDGFIRFFISDTNSSTTRVETDSSAGVDDGNRHRIVWNKIANNDAEIWVDGSEVAASVTTDQGFSSVADFNDDIFLFAQNEGGVNLPYQGIQDDVCIFNDSLTAAEIGSYENLP
jgi:hypothetical protein